MDFNQTSNNLMDEFRRNTGVLLPITKFILSNTLILSLLLVVPFKIFFWVYQIGYLSTFGINYDLILRNSIEAQGLWGEVFYSFVEIVVYPFWFFITLCLLFASLGFYRSTRRYLRKVNIFKSKKETAQKKVQSRFKRKLRIFISICEKGEAKVFNMATSSYLVSVLFFFLLSGLLCSAIFVHDKGSAQSKIRLEEFKTNGTCNDGWGQSGCYGIMKGEKKYYGYLITMTENNIYLMTNDSLVIIPKDDNVIVTREVNYR